MIMMSDRNYSNKALLLMSQMSKILQHQHGIVIKLADKDSVEQLIAAAEEIGSDTLSDLCKQLAMEFHEASDVDQLTTRIYRGHQIEKLSSDIGSSDNKKHAARRIPTVYRGVRSE